MKPCHEPIKTAKALGSERDMEVIDSSVKLSEESNCEFTPCSSKYNQDVTEPVTEEQPTSDSSNQDEQSSVKVLWMTWNTENDEFEYGFGELVDFVKTLPPTKRSMLRLSAKIFDPLGFLAPFTIVMKMLFQALCLDGTNWDDPLTGSLLDSWNQIINDLQAMKPIRVSRCYLSYVSHDYPSYELHGFSDASTKAYATVVYLRQCTKMGKWKFR